jgi:dihydroflavonol-4-reductase
VTSLVTGATGFLGRHLVESLATRGEAVRVFARPGADVERFRFLGADVAAGDVTDEVSLREAAAGCTRIYHLAGVVSHRQRDRRLLESVNVRGTGNVLAAAESGARIVHVSSIAAVGPVASPHERADEQHRFPAEACDLPYAAAKRAGEKLAFEAAARGVDVVVASPGFLLGPGDVHRVSTWPVSAFVARRVRFPPPRRLSFVDARDVARGLIELVEHGRSGERTILAGEAGNLSWRALFELVSQVSGSHRRTIDVPRPVARATARLLPWPVAPDEVRAASHWWFVTAAKAERELGFTTRPIEETIADTLKDHARIRDDS